MPQNAPKDERWLLRQLDALERRIKALETAPRAGNTSLSHGKLLIMDPDSGEVIASMAGAAGTDLSGNPVPAGLGAQVGSVNGGVLQPASVDATKVTFTARDLSGVTTTTSTTVPADPLVGDLWIDTGNGNLLNRWDGAAWAPLPIGSGAIQAGSIIASLIAANTITAAQLAAGSVTAEQIAAGAIDAMTITGATIITDSSTGGVYVYDGTPTAGNLIVSISSEGGTDQFGNAYPQGLAVFAGEIDGANINASVITAGSISAGTIGDSDLVNCDIQGSTIESTTFTCDSSGGQILVYASTTTTQVLTASGNYTVPAGVTALAVEAWGGGGGGAGGGTAGGANSGGYGGGGGAYSKLNSLAVTPGQVIPYVIGAGGAGASPNSLSSNGGITSFNGTSCRAYGGTAATLSATGKGGAAASGTGDVKFSGGAAGTATGSGGSGGGSSAGPASNGNASADNTGSGAKAGGSAVTDGGAGGTGGAANSNGAAGTVPGGGGGGGGGGSSAGNGGNGARGQIRVSYTSARSLVTSVSPVAGTDSYGNSYPAGFNAKGPAGAQATMSATPGFATTGSYVEFTSAEWAPMTVICPPSETLIIDIRFHGHNNLTANATIAVAPKVKSGSTALSSPVAVSDGAMIQGIGSAAINNDIQQSGRVVIGQDRLAGHAGQTLTIVPCWRISGGSATTANISYGEMCVRPSLYPVSSS